MNNCEQYGTKINMNGCLVCGAPQCCPQCCQIETLKEFSARMKNWWSTINCACPSPHADECVEIRQRQSYSRYTYPIDGKWPWLDEHDECECACHTQPVEDEDWK